MAATLASLAPLFDYLDRLEGRAPLDELCARLATLEVDLQELAEFLHFSPHHYARNLIATGPWYSVLALCWLNGQRSPIHDHAGSSCAVRVLRGTMTETRFDFAPNGQVRAVESRDYVAGLVIGSEDLDLHQVSNLQAGTADLVTLHVYTPPLRIMGTYSILDNTRGQELMLTEFSDAAGI
ncbi:MAG: cysteine dioxygenase family protein [Pirellulales bacterium]|nr:cysteine dioxygenase family protein [Pirellulales bacterium]